MPSSVPGQHYSSHVPKKTAEVGRVCSFPGCGTVLSIYNSLDRCGPHKSSKVLSTGARQRSKRRSKG